MRIKRLSILLSLLLMMVTSSYADGTRADIEKESNWRLGTDFQIKLAKGLKLDIEPELRLNDGLDSFLLNGGLSLRTFGFIYWGASYRLVCDREISGTTNFSTRYEYEWDISGRYAFDVSYKDDFGRLTPSFRVRYNNYTDEDLSDEKFMRYRAKLEYNIRKCSFTPSVYTELYHGLDEGMLSKIRYAAEVEFKANKKSSLSFGYKLDYFLLKYKNKNIFSVGYKCKL